LPAAKTPASGSVRDFEMNSSSVMRDTQRRAAPGLYS
jgi:hypothetical protein